MIFFSAQNPMKASIRANKLRTSVLAGLLVCSSLLAQQEDTPYAGAVERAQDAVDANDARIAAGEEVTTEESVTPDVVPAASLKGETISLNVDNQEVRVILRNIAELYELNIVIPDELQWRTSVNLRDVTWQQVFDIVLEQKGYSWAEVNGIIRIREGSFDMTQEGDPRVQILPNGNLRIEFRNTAVSDIVAAIARALDLNVVIPPDPALDSVLDLRLSNVNWEQVYQVALTQFGFGYLMESDIVIVRSLEQINSVPDVSRVFQVKYSEAEAMGKLLLAQSGVKNVVTDSRSNVVIVTGNPARFAEIKSLIDTLDRPTPQVMIESRFVEVSNKDIKQVGIDWTTLFSDSGFGIGTGYETTYNRDRNRDVQTGDNSSNNFSSNNTRTGTPPVTTSNTVIDAAINQVRSLLDTTATNRSDTAIFSAPAFNVVLRALKKLDDSKIVSNPTVLALNGQEAEIKIVDHYYMQQPGTISSDGRVTPGQVQRLDPLPGIELKVTPTISGGDFISLKVVPQVNDIVEFQRFETGDVPVVRQRTTLTHVMVKDRETLAIGGLVDEKKFTSSSKIPVLGHIPVAGRLFRYDRTSIDAKNQIIFITASILNPNETSYLDVVGLDRMNSLKLTDRDVQGANYVGTPEEQALNEAILRQRRLEDQRDRENKLNAQLEAYRLLEEKRAMEALKKLQKSKDVSMDAGYSEGNDAVARDGNGRVVPSF
jgi:type IV pilus assembly protein PilQ